MAGHIRGLLISKFVTNCFFKLTVLTVTNCNSLFLIIPKKNSTNWTNRTNYINLYYTPQWNWPARAYMPYQKVNIASQLNLKVIVRILIKMHKNVFKVFKLNKLFIVTLINSHSKTTVKLTKCNNSVVRNDIP
jgi:hypothetical protein